MTPPQAESHDQRPLLVIVSGAPGTGKTTLARRLAVELRLPLLTKDDVKEALYDTIGAPDRQSSAQLGRAAYSLLYVIAGRLLDAGVGALLESNFHRGYSEGDLGPLVTRAKAILLHCQGDPATIVRRYRERAERGERHPGHHDIEVVARLGEQLDGGLFEPLELGVPTLQVDTTTENEYLPGFREIVTFLRQASG